MDQVWVELLCLRTLPRSHHGTRLHLPLASLDAGEKSLVLYRIIFPTHLQACQHISILHLQIRGL
jgi:hypothetical protein